MSVRLNKALRELNIGIQTAVEFLEKKPNLGDIKADLNFKLSDEQFEALVAHFKRDAEVRNQAEKLFPKKQKEQKERKPMAGERGEDLLTPHDIPQFKPIGKIDLDGGKNKPVADLVKPEPKVEVKPEPKVEPKVEVKPEPKPELRVEVKPEPKVEPKVEVKPEPKPELKVEVKPEPKPAVVVEEVKKDHTTVAETPKEKPLEKKNVAPKIEQTQPKVETKSSDIHMNEKTVVVEQPEEKLVEVENKVEIFQLKSDRKIANAPKMTVLGKIDLDAINQSTRPKKKTKEERKKERDEKTAAIRQESAEKKKRVRIGIERVNINDAANQAPAKRNTNTGGNGNNQNQQGGIKKRTNNYNNNNRNNTNNNNNNTNTNNNNRNNTNNNNANNNRNNNNHGNSNFNNKSKGPQRTLEVNDEAVARQVKETLARLKNKPNFNKKGAKYRKVRRDAFVEQREADLAAENAESKILKLTEFVTVSELATMMDVSVNEVIGTLMSIGIMVSINQRLDAETINIVAEEFGFSTEYVSAELQNAITEDKDEEIDLKSRAPIVTVMGHVDHGKTSLLDYIRKTNVIAGEAGGITQHIGAYNVGLEDGRHITFLDTPGHEAFTAMRARGTQVTDIAIIIIAADDSVMPTTKEAIAHAQAASVPMVFAINKIDKPGANPEKIREDLAQMNLLVEDWGGKYQCQEISAKKGIGVAELMEKVLLEAEMLDLKANPNRKAMGSIIESSLDKGRGYVSTVLVSNGTLQVGDVVVAGTSFGRIKAMFNERNQKLEKVGPSEPAIILGLNGAPQAGDSFHIMETEQEARDITNKRLQLQREQSLRTTKTLSLEEIAHRIALGEFHELNLIVKGDVQGSVEALSDSLIKLSTEKILVNVIQKSVGQISENDVMLASTAENGTIVGFNVRPSTAAKRLAEQEGVEINTYSIIYDAIDNIRAAMEGMLDKIKKEIAAGQVEVKEVFKVSKVGTVAGAIVIEGKVHRTDRARLIRDGIVIFTGAINALKRYKDDAKEVVTGLECGISLVNCNDIQAGDIIETFTEIEVDQKL